MPHAVGEAEAKHFLVEERLKNQPPFIVSYPGRPAWQERRDVRTAKTGEVINSVLSGLLKNLNSSAPAPAARDRNVINLGGWRAGASSNLTDTSFRALELFANARDPSLLNVRHRIEALVAASRNASDKILMLIARDFEAETILDAVRALYAKHGTSIWLAAGVAILRECGVLAWPSLRSIANTALDPDWHVFIPLIAGLAGVPENERMLAMQQLARHPDIDIRARVHEEAMYLAAAARRDVLQALANSGIDDDVTWSSRQEVKDENA